MKNFLLLLMLLSSSAISQEDKLDSLFGGKKDTIANGFSGVVLIAENGRPFFHKAFGYREFENEIPLQTSAIFELASVSKQFTAMIFMMLKEKGKLNYDDSVGKYLEIPFKKITIRHLLTHTSGLPDYQEIMDKYWDKTKVAGNADCIEYLNRYAPPKLFEPGEKYEYSNTGYLLLASIAEKASGKDFIELCRQWIFKKIEDEKYRYTNPRTKASGEELCNRTYIRGRKK